LRYELEYLDFVHHPAAEIACEESLYISAAVPAVR
jgi:hypothetical protein